MIVDTVSEIVEGSPVAELELVNARVFELVKADEPEVVDMVLVLGVDSINVVLEVKLVGMVLVVEPADVLLDDSMPFVWLELPLLLPVGLAF